MKGGDEYYVRLLSQFQESKPRITRKGEKHKMFNRRKFLKTGCASVLGTLFATACTDVPAQIALPSARVRTIGFQEPWRNNGENAPFHTAIEARFYTEEGLDVKLVEGGPGVPAHINVLSGAQGIEIGCVASVGAMITWLAEGLPFVCTAAVLQKHPLGFVTLAKNLTPEQQSRPLIPQDLRGKRVGVQTDYELLALLSKNGMGAEDVTIVTIAGENPADLLTTTVDYASYWVVNQPWGLTEKGLEWKALMYADWAVPLYADVVFTTRERLTKEPETMRAFLRATVRGMRRMIDDPDFAVKASMKHGGGYDTEPQLHWRIGLQNQMMVSPDTDKNGLGWMDPDKFAEQLQFYFDQKQIRSIPKVSDVMTTEFLK